MDTFGIGIESSCDETGVALIKNGREIIANPLFSQINIHKEYGGVVPEKASRAHLEKIPYLLKEITDIIDKKNIKISYIAVTARPGLAGSLLIGYNAAHALKLIYNKPVIPIHHLEAHLYAPLLENEKITYPFLGLLLSGGNSGLYYIKGISKIKVIGDTLDDACGEALDKAAALLKMPYPGGPHIEKNANEFIRKQKTLKKNTSAIKNPLPVILKNQPPDKFQFSFSGLKTALLYFLKDKPKNITTEEIAYYFQERVIEIVLRNVKNAIRKYKIPAVVAAGGVLANQTLKTALKELCEKENVKLIVPSPFLCTDNAAMVAAAGYLYFKAKNNLNIKSVSSKISFF
ncbi:MAG: tRNA (adenosine(37)-N6)-threonylcarbamoyltransferase complex transferase subunit TsaD [Spirochaetia bacterium]|nr:tRNA (adenosine(37)-N6)-threonylcarbamoyltransferase complex transferase subunit TsaD [Spirochaetia bacterium]